MYSRSAIDSAWVRELHVQCWNNLHHCHLVKFSLVISSILLQHLMRTTFPFLTMLTINLKTRHPHNYTLAVHTWRNISKFAMFAYVLGWKIRLVQLLPYWIPWYFKISDVLVLEGCPCVELGDKSRAITARNISSDFEFILSSRPWMKYSHSLHRYFCTWGWKIEKNTPACMYSRQHRLKSTCTGPWQLNFSSSSESPTRALLQP